VKTKVSLERIAMAEEIAARYNNNNIICEIGHETWMDCVEQSHHIQCMVQCIVLNIKWCVYIIGQPGARGRGGDIIYIVFGKMHKTYANDLVQHMANKVENLLMPFYSSITVDEMLDQLPNGLSNEKRNSIRSRWPFFNNMRAFCLSSLGVGFPASSLFKSKVQTMYNTLKGHLDSNMQFSSIMSPIKVAFEQKYIIQMILAVVINA
jgi:hypothetical protein